MTHFAVTRSVVKILGDYIIPPEARKLLAPRIPPNYETLSHTQTKFRARDCRLFHPVSKGASDDATPLSAAYPVDTAFRSRSHNSRYWNSREEVSHSQSLQNHALQHGYRIINVVSMHSSHDLSKFFRRLLRAMEYVAHPEVKPYSSCNLRSFGDGGNDEPLRHD